MSEQVRAHRHSKGFFWWDCFRGDFIRIPSLPLYEAVPEPYFNQYFIDEYMQYKLSKQTSLNFLKLFPGSGTELAVPRRCSRLLTKLHP